MSRSRLLIIINVVFLFVSNFGSGNFAVSTISCAFPDDVKSTYEYGKLGFSYLRRSSSLFRDMLPAKNCWNLFCGNSTDSESETLLVSEPESEPESESESELYGL